MDVPAQLLRQKMPSKLSMTAKLKQQREKEKSVATVGANHPAVTVLHKNAPSNPAITSPVICCTSPRPKSPENGFMSQQAVALLTQKAGNDNASILTPLVILQPPPVLNMDVPSVYKDVDKDTCIVSSAALSDGTSTGGGTLINLKKTMGDPPLPDNFSFNHSVTHGWDDATGFHPSWSSFVTFGNLFRYKPTTRRLVPVFCGNLRPVGAQTVWLLHFMLQMYAIQQKTSILNNNHPTKNNTMVEPVASLAARL
jgi:hypothetical protein